MLTLLQGGVRPREPRTKVLVPCRLNVDGAWSDACVHNVSSRGMLMAADAAPRPGSYVEVRRGTLLIVGRVMWRQDRCFGIRTQDRISVDALVSEPRRRTAPPRGDGLPAGERRADSRLVA
ncbi:MAG: PilZ domain-containing protein, partial [Sphingomonas sp.]